MTEFWLLAALILVPGLLILAPPLLRPRIRVAADLNARNVQIARERLAELEADHQAGKLNPTEFEQAKIELEGNMLDDLRQNETSAGDERPSRLTLMVLLVLIPLGALALYQQLGTPQIIDRLAQGLEAGAENASMDELLARLEKRLQEEPDNVEGWFILGRSYMAQEQYPQAVRALEETYRLAPDNANVIVSLADALAMNAGGTLVGRPETLLQKALEVDPESATALWLLGMARQEQQDLAGAIAYWQRAIPLMQGDADALARLSGLIDQARSLAGQQGIELPASALAPVQAAEPIQAPIQAPVQPPVPDPSNVEAEATAPAEIRVSVRLDPALAAQVSPQDSLFIMARPLSGPRMPLAAVRQTVADLPLELTLTDAMAMMPQMKLSGFEQVVVQARVAKGGTPQAQSGDLQSDAVQTVTQGKPSLELVIDSVVP